MGVIVGKGILISTVDTMLTCPICYGEFDASHKIEKAKYPYFKTKCPKCKSAIGINVPIFSSHGTKCFEWNPPKGHEAIETETDFSVTNI
jgi:hypothetical protein